MNNSKYIKITLLTLCSISLLFFVACTSFKSKEYPGPFVKQSLIDKGLISEFTKQKTLVRIIYPEIAQKELYRSLLNTFIDKQPEIQSFFNLDSDNTSVSQSPLSNKKLGIYIYEISHRKGIVSFAFQTDFISNETQRTSWFALNFDTRTNKAFSYSYMFEDTEGALNSISNFIREDISRQKILRGYDINNDTFLNMDTHLFITLLNAFVLVPSQQKDTKLAGITVYLTRAGNREEGIYASNVPTSVFSGFLNESFKNSFISEVIPITIEDPKYKRTLVFPDIHPSF